VKLLPTRLYATAVFAVIECSSCVGPSITSRRCTKRLNVGSHKQSRTIAHGLQFYDAKDLYAIPMESTSTTAPTAGGRSKKSCVIRPVQKFPAQRPCHRKFVHPPRWSHPWRCAGGGIRGVINNFGGSRSFMITFTVQLTLTRLFVWKSVDDMQDLACSLSHACCAIVELTATMRVQNYIGAE